jgi:molecular chaperone DnaJ
MSRARSTGKRDYYEVLGVNRDADDKAIKAAYRKLAVQYHPDKNPGDASAEARFKEGAEAYSVLSDANQRARYDRFGHQGVAGAAGQGFDPSTFADFSDILGDLFGMGDVFGGGRRRGPAGSAGGSDLRYDLAISFREAAFGHETMLKIPRLETCDECRGSGGKGGAAPVTCGTCRGRGQVRYTQGFFAVAQACPQCRGEGVTIADPCGDCRGAGLVERERRIQVKIPAGVDSGARLRLVGEGEHGRRGGRPGDLYVVLQVEPDDVFERDGADVHAPIEIDYPQLVLGGTTAVETLHGKEDLEIPAGTQPGQQFRVRGKGVPRLDGRGRGDHIAHVALRVPEARDLEDEEVALLKRLAELHGSEVREERSVIERVRNLFG